MEPPLRCPRKSQWLSLSAASPNVSRQKFRNKSQLRASVDPELLPAREERGTCPSKLVQQVSQVRMKSLWSHFTELNCRVLPRRTSYFNSNPSCELEKKKKKKKKKAVTTAAECEFLSCRAACLIHPNKTNRERNPEEITARTALQEIPQPATLHQGARWPARVCLLGSSTSVEAVYVLIQTDV